MKGRVLRSGVGLVQALLESRIKVFFVTHMYALASRLSDEKSRSSLFLRAERRGDGSRTFRVLPGKPLRTSYGRDLYDQIFAAPPPVPRRAQRSFYCLWGRWSSAV